MIVVNRDGLFEPVAVTAHFLAPYDVLSRSGKTARRSFLFLGRQIGAITLRLFHGLVLAPLGNFGVVSADEYFRHFPPAVICRARVMWEIEQRTSCARRCATNRRRSIHARETCTKRHILRGRSVNQ